MRKKSSRPSPEQDVSKNEPKQPSSTSLPDASMDVGAATAAAADIAALASGQNSNPLSRVVFVNRIMLFAASNAKRAFELEAINTTWADSIRNFTLKNHPRFGFTKDNLLEAVALGKESRTVNLDRQPGEIFAADILLQYPDLLLEKGTITDWGGRTFKDISAFQYALWAKDFKMLEMMLKSIPVGEEGDAIRTELLRQYEQVTIPRYQGGGLTYTHTYERPKVDAAGIPIKNASGNWDCETVTEERWGNHFDITPLLNAYNDYYTHFDARTWPEREACWIKVIGTQQRLLPIHILQRYCDPGTPFPSVPYGHQNDNPRHITVPPVINRVLFGHQPPPVCPPVLLFTGLFKRTTRFCFFNEFYSIISSGLSIDFSLFRCHNKVAAEKISVASVRALPDESDDDDEGWGHGQSCYVPVLANLAAVRQIDEVSTNEIEKIKRLLTGPAQSQTQLRP